MGILIPLNSYLISKFIYINNPPEDDNPLVIAEWSINLINLEFIIVKFFSTTYFIF